jgi:hypothetical protein
VPGGGVALGFLTGMTIGPLFVLPATALTAAVMVGVLRHHALDGIAGLVSGLGLPVLYVAFLNRDGPGDVCRTFADGGQSCRQEWSPWPWLAIGAGLVIGGALLFAWTRPRALPAPPRRAVSIRPPQW